MRLLKLFSFTLLAVFVSLISAGVTQAAVTVDGPYIDTATQGDWRGKFNIGGSCFYLLPTPPCEIGEFNIDTSVPPPYCAGGSLSTSGKLVWDLFADTDKPIYTWFFDPLTWWTETRPVNGMHPADQWNPCVNDFLGATFDNGDLGNEIVEPLVSEVTVQHTGSFRIAYYFLEELAVCGDLKYNLWINGNNVKTGTVADFDAGKYVVFNINGLAGTSNIRLEVVNPYPSILSPNCQTGQSHRTNSLVSGIFIDKCNNQFQGCTPGYWKQSQHFGSWVNYYPVSNGSAATKFCSVFTCPTGFSISWSEKGAPKPVAAPTLLQALQANGGGVNALARHATAALLNASNPDVTYPRSVTEIKNMVKAALMPGGDISGTAELFAKWNESYWNGMHNCPLSK